uniref:Uncharacterized protein n=1 Tax=Otus sunia TaxID=257818 RepID=A0A8C8BDD9_9STRI
IKRCTQSLLFLTNLSHECDKIATSFLFLLTVSRGSIHRAQEAFNKRSEHSTTDVAEKQQSSLSFFLIHQTHFLGKK